MKNFIYLTMMLLLVSCGNDIDASFENYESVNKTELGHAVSEAQAIDLASSFWGLKEQSRSLTSEVSDVQYILKKPSLSRGTNSLPDTLAYIFNFTDEGGFAIIAADNRVNPVLAYSKDGNFTLDNKIASDNFIDRLNDYISIEIEKGFIYEAQDEQPDSCMVVRPEPIESLSQDYPFNKYVIIEHPDCPAGCVAVATANVMIQTLNSANYHNSQIEFSAIRRALEVDESIPPVHQVRRRIVGPAYPAPNTSINYTHDEAIDSVAKMLYWIGKDVGMTYTTTKSGAISSRAYTLLKQYKYDVITSYDCHYNIQAICDYINTKDCVVYMRGSGHAWICNGTSYCVKPDGRTYNEYVYCDWGWGGYGNGFFNGDVFKVSSSEFTDMTYFAIKRHTKNYIL